MEYTAKLKLKKPEYTDVADIADINENMELIESAINSHSHEVTDITDFPATLENPYSLTISLDGTSQGAYNGSAAKNIDITAEKIGAARESHVHEPFELTSEDDLNDITGELFWGDYGNTVLNKPTRVNNFYLKQIIIDRNSTISGSIENGKVAVLIVQILYAESIYKRVKMIEYEGTKSEYWTEWQTIG